MMEYTGRTVTEAIEAGLQDLSLSQEDVDIEVLEEGRGGVFGLGTRLARVAMTPRGEDRGAAATATGGSQPLVQQAENASAQAPELKATPQQQTATPGTETADAARNAGADEAERGLELARDFLQRLLDHMELKARVEASIQPPSELEEEETYYLNIEGEDLGMLIGRRGETLDAIQYLARLVVNQHTHRWPHIEVDVEHYKQRRERSLMRLAESMADRAASERRTVVLEAMPARERRIVHMALRGRADVVTKSIGEGENRKVTIAPV